MPIDREVQAYKLAMSETANAEFNALQARIANAEAHATVMELVEKHTPHLASRFRSASVALMNAEEALKAAKDAEKDAKAALSEAAVAEAVATGQSKREIHPNINIVSTSNIIINKMFQATQWLLDNGKLEDITLKPSKPAWYRDHKARGTLPEDAITVEEIPLARIDSPEKWETGG